MIFFLFALLQAVYPRYFMIAAKYDLHAPVAVATGALGAMRCVAACWARHSVG